jgi:hypothetical protein
MRRNFWSPAKKETSNRGDVVGPWGQQDHTTPKVKIKNYNGFVSSETDLLGKHPGLSKEGTDL